MTSQVFGFCNCAAEWLKAPIHLALVVVSFLCSLSCFLSCFLFLFFCVCLCHQDNMFV